VIRRLLINIARLMKRHRPVSDPIGPT
jgi:hypothetical protein